MYSLRSSEIAATSSARIAFAAAPADMPSWTSVLPSAAAVPRMRCISAWTSVSSSAPLICDSA